MSKIKVLELFGGYGSQALALKNIGLDIDATLCEIDSYAIQTYNMLHGETENIGDICKVDPTKLQYYDLITYSFPCTNISLAGHQDGLTKGSGTASSLLWECEKIIAQVKPKYLLMENVKNLTSKKFMPLFQEWLSVLETLGYKNFWKVLNAKDFGIPQNRERVFCVSILGGGEYTFPEPQELKIRLKDVLDETVDQKYFLSDKIQERFHYKPNIGNNIIGSTAPDFRTIGQRDVVFNTNEIVGALVATDYKQPKQILISEDTVGMSIFNNTPINTVSPSITSTCGTATGKASMIIIDFDMPNGKKAEVNIEEVDEPSCFKEVRTEHGKLMRKIIRQQTGKDTTTRDKDSKKFVTTNNGLANCLTTSIGAEQIIVEPSIIKLGNIYPSNGQNGNIHSCDGLSPTISAGQGKIGNGIGSNNSPKILNNFKIRKLTPRECWRLMGVKDEQFDKIVGISDTQLYKMAGNSIVVNVLEAIFRNMFLK